MKKQLLSAALVALLAAPAFAQNSDADDQPSDAKEIVVTGTRTQEVGGVQTPDTSKAKAVLTQETVTVYGDYDVDGTTAVALMAEQLAELGLECSYYIPDRYREGYGVSAAGIDYTIAAGYDLLITLDCGIKAHTQLARAHEAQIDIIVCDHHQPDSTLPPGIILNPKQAACAYPYAELSGCGVAFKLLQGLYQFLQRDEQQLFKSLDLVALAIGADIVELLGENRVLCARGLTQLNTAPRPAFLAILALASKSLPLSLRDIVFVLAPRINAAGRIASGKRAVDWMLSTDQKEIEALAIEINTDNTTRRALDQENTAQALAQIASDPKFDIQFTTVVYDPNWHKGVVGIVASRLKERFNRPAIIFAPDGNTGEELRGSGRSLTGFHLRDALDIVSKKEPGLILKFGGHAMAAGLTIRKNDFDRFDACFQEVANSLLSEELLERQHIHDGALQVSEFTPEIGDLLADEIWGQGFPQPIFYGEFEIAEQSLMKEKHLRLLVKPLDSESNSAPTKPLTAVWFNRTQSLPSKAKLAYRLVTDRYQGQARVQLMIEAHDESSST